MGFIKLIAEFGFKDKSTGRKTFNFVNNVFINFYSCFIKESINISVFDLIKEYLKEITDLAFFICFVAIKPTIKR